MMCNQCVCNQCALSNAQRDAALQDSIGNNWMDTVQKSNDETDDNIKTLLL